jgi:signal transduction histidine kinase
MAGRRSERIEHYYEHYGKWLEIGASPVRTGGIAVYFRDSTERNVAEHALREREQALREADRRKDEFLATLAHELRNPLAPIRNAVQLLSRQGPADSALQSARQMIDRQVRHMVRLIDDLLDVSRITQGKIELRKERVSLATIVEQALETSRPHLGHELTVSLPSEPLHIDADPVRLAQVFSNLLNNACKYTEKGGRIWLTAEREGSEVVVKIKDTGIGLAPQHLPQLFRMFSQAPSSLERSQGGLGVGLSLARGLVEMHHGRIEARSAGQGLGSEFIVRLPALALAPGAQPLDPDAAGAGASGVPRRILVVEDNRDTAFSLAALLRMEGNQVEIAHDGLEALQKASGYEPEVVLLDIGLPKMDGYDACRAMRAQPWGKRALIIAVTGWGQDEDRRRSKEAGFDMHLVKPVEHPALLKLLADVS